MRRAMRAVRTAQHLLTTFFLQIYRVRMRSWPAAHIINFRFIPSSQRILYINTIQVGYNAFLSTMQAAGGSDESDGKKA